MEHLAQVHVVRVAPCPVSLLRFRHVNLLGQPTVSGDACHPYELRHVNPVGEILRFSPWVAKFPNNQIDFSTVAAVYRISGPRPVGCRSGSGKFAEQRGHLDCCHNCFKALIGVVIASASQHLILVLGGEHAEDHGHACR